MVVQYGWAPMNKRIKYVYKSLLINGAKIAKGYNIVSRDDKFVILLEHTDKQESLRIPK